MDPVVEWTQAQQRVMALTEGLSSQQADAVVPATPGWTVRQLLAHMIGLDADVLAGDEPDDHNESWTQAQVDRRADDDVAVLLGEWRGLSGPMQRYLAETSPRPLGDVVIHEQDLRGALDAPGARDNPGLLAIRERMAGRLADSVADAGLAPIALRSDSWTFGPDEAPVLVRADDFDLTRAVLSRRTAEQLRTWTERGDIAPYLSSFATLGALPPVALPE